ncbi:MAG: FixH family protein [Rhodospirillales bacterium]|nr:FixH family protein [Rhodospirillales bacterium]
MRYPTPAMPPAMPPSGRRSAWLYFPWILAVVMAIVMAVNFGMMWAALHTFPGTATDTMFDDSNHYDKVLETARREAELGWSLAVDATGPGLAVVLHTRDGQMLEGARVVAMAQRPLGTEPGQRLAFRAASPRHHRGAGPRPLL